MVKFKLFKDAQGKIIRLTVKGHSGFAEEGEDIVCASVSATVWMTLNGIEENGLATLDYVQEDGFVDCKISAERDEACDYMLQSLVSFILKLAKQYKKYIFVSQV